MLIGRASPLQNRMPTDLYKYSLTCTGNAKLPKNQPYGLLVGEAQAL